MKSLSKSKITRIAQLLRERIRDKHQKNYGSIFDNIREARQAYLENVVAKYGFSSLGDVDIANGQVYFELKEKYRNKLKDIDRKCYIARDKRSAKLKEAEELVDAFEMSLLLNDDQLADEVHTIEQFIEGI